jgi:hypothetical protein
MSMKTTSPPAMNARASIPKTSPMPLSLPVAAPDIPAASSPAALPWLE